MPKQVVIIGPPGTGKTTAATRMTGGWLKGGVKPDQVAYLAFTKAAAIEAAERIFDENKLHETDDRIPYFRTIHSLAYRGLKRDRPEVRMMTTADMKSFSQAEGFDGTFTFDKWEDMAAIYQKLQGGGKTVWDACLRAYTISRISAKDSDDLAATRTCFTEKAARSTGFLENSAYQVFVDKYEAFKEKNGLIDFTDMLAYALTQMRPLDDVKHVVIDEAQDVSEICASLTDRLFQNAETITYAGDEDQAIYFFSGADASIFINRFKMSSARIFLRQTHRFGGEIVDLAGKVIRRVSDRIEKEVWGLEGKKHPITLTGSFEPVLGNALILHRHVAGCEAAGELYKSQGLPFRNERGPDPLGSHGRVRAFQTLADLSSGRTVPGNDAAELIYKYLFSRVMSSGKSVQMIPRGAVQKLKTDSLPGSPNLYDLLAAKVLTQEGMDAITHKHYESFDHSHDFRYYQRVLDNGHPLTGENIPVITTIHGSKGRQADKVVVFSELHKKCWEDPDSEHRLAFVALTRTKGPLEICAQQTVDWAEMRYDYPNLEGGDS